MEDNSIILQFHKVIGYNYRPVWTNFDFCCLPAKMVTFYKNAFKVWSSFVSCKAVKPAEVLV